VKKRRKRTNYAFQRQFGEEPSIIPSCPGIKGIKDVSAHPKCRTTISLIRMHSTSHQNINYAIYSIAAQLQGTTSFWQNFLIRAISVRAQKD